MQRTPEFLHQLIERARQGISPLERHQAAYYAWECGLRMLASVAIVEYATFQERDEKIDAALQAIACPSLGHWLQITRLLIPKLAEQGDPHFTKIRTLVTGKGRDDLFDLIKLDNALRETLYRNESAGKARPVTRIGEFFDRIARYRNREIGHGFLGSRSDEFYEHMAPLMAAGIEELWREIDVLAGRSLHFVSAVEGTSNGDWRIQRFDLSHLKATLIDSLVLPRDATSRLPMANRLYLLNPTLPEAPWLLVYPLAIYEFKNRELYFYGSSDQEKARIAFQGCKSGENTSIADPNDQKTLLTRLLRTEISDELMAEWIERSEHEKVAEFTVPSSAPRRQIGKFELVSRLGSGAAGTVFRAWDPALRRTVALKRMHRAGDSDARKRFTNEMRSLTRVKHNHLVQVYDNGEDGGDVYFTMELVEGADLARVLKGLGGSDASKVDSTRWETAVSTACEKARADETPIAESEDDLTLYSSTQIVNDSGAASGLGVDQGHIQHVVAIMRDVASATQALHEAGVVHRDIKPGNIMLDTKGNAVLMDLGLAKLLDEQENRITKTRAFVGTLRYASPEQLINAKLTPATDVYGLGATLWELLTLRPFLGITDEVPDRDAMTRVQTYEPDDIRQFNPAVPAELEAVVLRCVQKDARKRYSTARDLAKDLDAWLSGQPLSVKPESRWKRTTRRWVNNPRLAAPVSFVFVLALLGLFSMFGSRHKLDHDPTSHEIDHNPGAHEMDQSTSPTPSKTVDPESPKTNEKKRGDSPVSVADVLTKQVHPNPDEKKLGESAPNPSRPSIVELGEGNGFDQAFLEFANKAKAILANRGSVQVHFGEITFSPEFEDLRAIGLHARLSTALRRVGIEIADAIGSLEINGSVSFQRSDPVKELPSLLLRLAITDCEWGEDALSNQFIVNNVVDVANLLGLSGSIAKDGDRQTEPYQLGPEIRSEKVFANRTSPFALRLRGGSNRAASLSIPQIITAPMLRDGDHSQAYVNVEKLGEMEIEFTNDSPDEVAIMPMVNGVSTFEFLKYEGAASHDDPPSHYLASPRSRVVITGWRKSLTEIVPFRIGLNRDGETSPSLAESGLIAVAVSRVLKPEDKGHPSNSEIAVGSPSTTSFHQEKKVIAPPHAFIGIRYGSTGGLAQPQNPTRKTVEPTRVQFDLVDMTGALDESAEKIRKWMSENESVHGSKLRFAGVENPGNPHSHFEPWMEGELRRRIGDLLADDADLILRGTLSFKQRREADKADKGGLAVELEFNQGGKSLHTISRRIQPLPYPRKFALLIGIDSYAWNDFGDLQYAEADARALGDALADSGYEVTLLTNKEATRSAILEALREISRQSQREDVIWIGLSGRGGTFADRASQQGGSYFLPFDASFPPGPADIVTYDELLHALSKAMASRRIVSIDACRNVVHEARALPTTTGKMDIPEQTAILLACSAKEVSMELPELRHGAFTYALLEGLKSRAGGEISASELGDYVRRAVPRLVRDRTGSLQRPQSIIYGDVDLGIGVGVELVPPTDSKEPADSKGSPPQNNAR
jgi:serine/threonine protein kinase